MRVCNATQAELQALLLDGEALSLPVEALWAHVESCDRCARAVAHDRAMRRVLARARRSTPAPQSLRRRLRDALDKRANGGGKQPGGRSRST
jgi:anti-sigma factor RsiW